MIFNTHIKMQHLPEHKEALAVFQHHLPNMVSVARQNQQAAELSMEHLVRYAHVPNFV